MELSRQEYWSGLPFPSPGDLPNPGIEPGSPVSQADSLMPEPPEEPPDNEWLDYILSSFSSPTIYSASRKIYLLCPKSYLYFTLTLRLYIFWVLYFWERAGSLSVSTYTLGFQSCYSGPKSLSEEEILHRKCMFHAPHAFSQFFSSRFWHDDSLIFATSSFLIKYF